MSDILTPGKAANSTSTTPFSPADLPIDGDGRVYHLQVKPGQLAPDILLVGDPGRVEFIGSTFMRDLTFEHEHRGLVTVTGTAISTGVQASIIAPLETTVATTGIGTPSLEIVVQELVALNEIDFQTRTRKSAYPRLHVIRVGTSGGLQESTALGTPIITSYAIGLDNTGLYYETPFVDETCKRLEGELAQLVGDAMDKESRFYGKIHPYVSRATPALVEALWQASQNLGVQSKLGLTVSASGFFAPQGRDISRLKPSVPELDHVFSAFDPGIGDQCIENMEMETSFLVHFLGGLGYWAGAICPAIANRQQNTFDLHYQQSIKNATEIALCALATVRSQDPAHCLPG